MNTTFLTATDSVSLVQTLRDWYKTPKSDADTEKREYEKIDLGRLLLTIAKDDCLPFPIRIEHEDKPDFRVIGLNATIAIETTRIVPEQRKRAEHIVSQMEHPPATLPTTLLQLESKKRNNTEIEQIIKGQGMNWANEEDILRTWERRLSDVITSKTAKIISNREQTSNETWLLITEWPDEAERALRKVAATLHTYWTSTFHFDKVFVATYQALFLLSPRGMSIRPIINWR